MVFDDDCTEASIEFVLDGKSLGVAFEKVHAPLYPCFFVANYPELCKEVTLCSEEGDFDA
jgi:hypothetical protein